MNKKTLNLGSGILATIAITTLAAPNPVEAYSGCCQMAGQCRNDFFGIFCVWAGWAWDPREFCNAAGTTCIPKPRPSFFGRCVGATAVGRPPCFETTAAECAIAGGTYGGDGVPCPAGACSYSTEGCCLEVSQETCDIVSGTYAGNGTSCSIELCTVDPIPTTSEWGLLAFTGVMLAAGTIVLRRRSDAMLA